MKTEITIKYCHMKFCYFTVSLDISIAIFFNLSMKYEILNFTTRNKNTRKTARGKIRIFGYFRLIFEPFIEIYSI